MKELITVEQARAFILGDRFEPAAFRDLDLRPLASLIEAKDFGASLFLGCDLEPSSICHLAAGGAYIIPDIKENLFKFAPPVTKG